MPKTRAQKKEIVSNLIDKIRTMKSLVFVDFTGLTTKETDELRAKCRPEGDFMVTKKTLFDVAVQESARHGVVFENVAAKNLEGEMALVFGYIDELQPMKVTHAFTKEHKALVIRGGVHQGVFLDVNTVLAMAKLPGKQELRARLVGSLRAPIVGIMNVLQGNLRGLVQVLNARSAQTLNPKP